MFELEKWQIVETCLRRNVFGAERDEAYMNAYRKADKAAEYVITQMNNLGNPDSTKSQKGTLSWTDDLEFNAQNRGI